MIVLRPHVDSRRTGFTLVEMLSIVALLIIVLGMMVSMARYVRRRSAEDLTRRILTNLDAAMRQYSDANGTPAILGALPAGEPSQAGIEENAWKNNQAFVRLLRNFSEDKAFHDLPLSIYDQDQNAIRDAWGTPIVFMASQHPQIGMAPRNRWFFFSAGPDRLYLTRDDNQYSYEAPDVSKGW